MSVPRHQVLVDAVAAGDPDQARIAVDEHMREAAEQPHDPQPATARQRLTPRQFTGMRVALSARLPQRCSP